MLINTKKAMNLFRQIVEGIKAVHSCNLIHRDIKPQNIFLDETFSIKIGDFGACILNKKEDLLNNICGTFYYMAPEMESLKEYDCAVDLWSIGCCLFFMLTGKYTFFPSPFNHSICFNQLTLFFLHKSSIDIKHSWRNVLSFS